MMEVSTMLVKLTGAVLLAWTIWSIFKHFREKMAQRVAAGPKADDQSMSEQVLNGLLLYLWLAFMVAFSLGMILNN